LFVKEEEGENMKPKKWFEGTEVGGGGGGLIEMSQDQALEF